MPEPLPDPPEHHYGYIMVLIGIFIVLVLTAVGVKYSHWMQASRRARHTESLPLVGNYQQML